MSLLPLRYESLANTEHACQVLLKLPCRPIWINRTRTSAYRVWTPELPTHIDRQSAPGYIVASHRWIKAFAPPTRLWIDIIDRWWWTNWDHSMNWAYEHFTQVHPFEHLEGQGICFRRLLKEGESDGRWQVLDSPWMTECGTEGVKDKCWVSPVHPLLTDSPLPPAFLPFIARIFSTPSTQAKNKYSTFRCQLTDCIFVNPLKVAPSCFKLSTLWGLVYSEDRPIMWISSPLRWKSSTILWHHTFSASSRSCPLSPKHAIRQAIVLQRKKEGVRTSYTYDLINGGAPAW